MPFRLPLIADADLTDRQRELMAEVTGARFALTSGPFLGWIRRPELGAHLNGMGLALRVAGTIDRQLFEIVVLTVARWAKADYMWDSHVPQATAIGLPEDIIAAIGTATPPAFRSDAQALVHRATLELLSTRTWSDSSYREIAALLSPDEIVELVGTITFYLLGSMALNAFGVPPLTDGEKRSIADRLAST